MCANQFPVGRVRRKESKTTTRFPCPAHTLAQSCVQLSLPLLSSILTVGDSSVCLYSSSSLTNLSIARSSANYPLLCASAPAKSKTKTYHPYIFLQSLPLWNLSAASRSITQSSQHQISPSHSESLWPGDFAKSMISA